MKTGSFVVDTYSLVEVVVVDGVGVVVIVNNDGDTVDIDSVATLDAVVGCVDPYDVGIGVVDDVCHDGFRRKYNFDKRLGDCDEKLFSSFRYTE